MTANHTAMFEVLYQVCQLISLTLKLCEGRDISSQTCIKHSEVIIFQLTWKKE